MSNDVKSWLEQLGLGAYAVLFTEHDIDWQLLDTADLRDARAVLNELS